MPSDIPENETKRAKIYRQLGQGLKVLHEDKQPEVDILAVPGLGTNPEECWTWTPTHKSDTGRANGVSTSSQSELSEPSQQDVRKKQGFNWIRDKDGLASLFPKSRIILYDYASAWTGKRKVRATMKGICAWLLDDLKERRKVSSEVGRPLIMIGHSMGGVVIAKTLCMARARSEFEAILTCTVGCLFFGAPFGGSNMAKIALMYSSVFGNEAYESLLSFMRAEKNDTLDEVTNDFMEISTKLSPPIDLVCAYETVATIVSYSERFADKAPRLLQHKAFKASARAVLDLGSAPFKTGTHFVDDKSAVLQGAHPIALTADHRNLIRFESVASEKFGPIKVALSTMVQKSKTNARKRVLSSGQSLLSQRTINQVRQSLEGVDMRLKFRTRVSHRLIKSWLISEPVYIGWLARNSLAQEDCPYLWLKGAAGLGKTNASLAAIQEINRAEEQHLESAHGQNGVFIAYFLCEWSPGCDTAEELLQSLITQIINQDESLAQHGARWFVPEFRYRGTSQAARGAPASVKATTTVDNLWRCLQDMLDDPAVNSIHLIINNMHLLETNTSTTALLAKLRSDADALKDQPHATRRVKWLITSRNDRHISQYLHAESVAAIDLENDHEYGAKVKSAQRQHARDAIQRLKSSKQYTSDLAYDVRNSIEVLSEDETWIDVFCILLEHMPSDTSHLAIRKWVNEVSSYNIRKLIGHAWEKILSENSDSKLEVEEILKALTIAYEPPTVADLAVLTQIEDLQLSKLVRNCAPVLEIASAGEHQGKVVFTNPEFAERLHDVAYRHNDAPDDPQKKRYHGLMALRCFKYIQSSLKNMSAKPSLADVTSRLLRSSNSTASFDEVSLIDFDDEREEIFDAGLTSAASSFSSSECPYPFKYLFRHLSEGFPDVAEELCAEDEAFWGRDSDLRNAWLKEYQKLTSEVKDLSTRGMSALHVAAAIGAKELVSILVRTNGFPSLSWTNEDGMTPLHVAASNNHIEVVDALIRTGVDIEAGHGTSGTALHIAALHGNCETMTMLINQGANINASSRDIGPVINAAILSGTVDAVKQIMDGDVHFDLDYTKCDAPLSLSARMSEPSLFQDILETGREKWLQNAKLLDQALIAASYNGRLECVRILLRFPHAYTNDTMKEAVFSAATEKKWASVNELLDHVIKTSLATRWNFRLDDSFFLAATSREERIEVLEKIWLFSKHTIAQEVRDYSLYQATVLKKEPTVKWLLDVCKANANATAERPSLAESTETAPPVDYSTALNAAASSGNASLVKSLLVKGATIDSDAGYSLQLAASEGHLQVVQTLIEFGASVNKRVSDSDEIGFFSSTALQAACENRRVDVVRALLAHGADPNLGGGPSTNPITAATERSLSDVLEVLLEAPDINVNVSGGNERSTPLINAATHMPVDTIPVLLAHGADVNAQNSLGDTALIMAASRGDKASVELLCAHGADVTYRSPQRGLAIQAAAQSQNAQCAYILAEKMAAMIEAHREAALADAAELRSRNTDISTLKGVLAETNEQLALASKDVKYHQLENERIAKNSAFQGETFESIKHQMKIVQDERIELLKQLDGSKGQMGLAELTITRLRALLDEERATNDDLRRRNGWAALQEERNEAVNMLEKEKVAAAEALMAEQEDRKHLYGHIASMESELLTLQTELEHRKEHAQAVAVATSAQWDIEKEEKAKLQNEVNVLQKELEDVKDTLAAIQAAASMAAPSSGPPSISAKTAGSDDYFQGGTAAADEQNVDATAPAPEIRPVQRAATQPTMVHSSNMSNPTASPSGSPIMTPGSPASPGFRTVHGQHRPDGSLGGYRRSSTMLQRTSTESLSNPSNRNGGMRREGSTPLSPLSPRLGGLSEMAEERAPMLPPRDRNGRTFREV